MPSLFKPRSSGAALAPTPSSPLEESPMPIRLTLSVLALTGLLAACSSTPVVAPGDDPVGDEVFSGSQDAGTGAAAQGLGADGGMRGQAMNPYTADPANPLYEKVIYFEYDSAQVRESDQAVLANHAAFLAANPGIHITLEGHADERGSREYNIGLGDRRAQSVKRLMALQGASAGQIGIVSYGEEKPAVEGHGEAVWAQNRRVEIVYPAQ